MIRVHLTYGEILLAWHVASQQATNALKRARDRGQAGDGAHHGAESYAWTLDVRGALGELATSKGLNLSWTGHMEVGRVDVGGKVEVRTVDQEHFRLIIHPTDIEKKPDMPCVLADITNLPEVVLVGWIRPRECTSNADWWAEVSGNGRPAYWVPREVLHSCVELRRMVHREIAEE